MATPAELISEITARAYSTNLMGAAVTCTPPGADPVSCNAILSYGVGEEQLGADGYGQNGEARIQVADMPTIPKDTTLNTGSVLYEINYADLSPCGMEWICEISKR